MPVIRKRGGRYHSFQSPQTKQQPISRVHSPVVKKKGSKLVSREVIKRILSKPIYSQLSQISGNAEEFNHFFERKLANVEAFSGTTNIVNFINLFNAAYFDAKSIIENADHKVRLLNLRLTTKYKLKIFPKEVFKFKNLKRLRLGQTSLSDQGIAQLERLKEQNPTIKITL